MSFGRWRKVGQVFIAGVLLVATASCGGDTGEKAVAGRVVFVGASITEGWDFDHYFPGRDLRKVIHYDADKTRVWGEVERRHPQIVVVKECAAYFSTGGDTPLDEYHEIVRRMVALIRGAAATPVLATTIPVDVGAGDCTAAQLAQITSFNAWLRSYSADQGLVCLDLAAAVADADGELPADFHDGDGLHPNAAGYDRLSAVVLPALESAGL